MARQIYKTHMVTKVALIGVATALSLLGSLMTATFAHAVSSGDSVVLLIPAAGNQPEPPNGIADRLIYTGGKVMAQDDFGGCAFGTGFPFQNAVLVDPDGGRSGRIIGVITISYGATPVPPGTKLRDLAQVATCWINETPYVRYVGIVE